MTTMKAGIEASDPRLGRVPSYDDRSRAYRVRDLLTARAEYRRQLHPRPASPGFDQSGPACDGPYGDSGCTGFSHITALNASPHRRRPVLGHDAACELYRAAQDNDEWPGRDYGGTSVLAVCQQSTARGWIKGYRWIGAGSQRMEDDYTETLEYLGGVINGTRWLNSMFMPRPSGLLEVAPDSGEAGGHAYFSVSHRYAALPGEGPAKLDLAVIQQTWGAWWGVKWYGVGGHAFIKLEDLFTYLLPREFNGEAVYLEEP